MGLCYFLGENRVSVADLRRLPDHCVGRSGFRTGFAATVAVGVLVCDGSATSRTGTATPIPYTAPMASACTLSYAARARAGSGTGGVFGPR